jgi:hypothetical protein
VSLTPPADRPPAWGVALAGGAVTELVVVHTSDRSGLDDPVLIGISALAVIVAGLTTSAGVRAVAVAALVAALLVAPASWAVDTLGHVTSGTFPIGGPATTGMTAGGSGRGGTGGGGNARAGTSRRASLTRWGHVRCGVTEN